MVSSRPSCPNGKHQSFLPSPAEGFDLIDFMSVGAVESIFFGLEAGRHMTNKGRDQQY